MYVQPNEQPKNQPNYNAGGGSQIDAVPIPHWKRPEFLAELRNRTEHNNQQQQRDEPRVPPPPGPTQKSPSQDAPSTARCEPIRSAPATPSMPSTAHSESSPRGTRKCTLMR
ncbi:hypothetical protein HPB47_020958 [Ixodes persulcatus]|uniref:Uncharacterized protein n=1 Tax=Ixodes persulcatus TaxID=34615 RepID=A0AC60QE00_IXOPE|nr:hypothetical protein HPB47_020958 [Ixodes persulcatus]